MKRDLDLIRRILLDLEAKEGLSYLQMKYEDIDVATRGYHAELLVDAGFVKGKVKYREDGLPIPFLMNLTWEGHEFLNSIREEKVYNKVTAILKPMGGFTMEVLKEVASAVTKQFLGLTP